MLPQRAAGSTPLKVGVCEEVDEVRWWGGRLTKETHRQYMKTFSRVNRPSNETVWGRGARTGEGGGTFFPLHPPCLPVLSAHVYVFWHNLIVCTAQTSGLLKQPDQVELSYCKCSPSGVSHFQGPHEHMRHSCETG